MKYITKTLAAVSLILTLLSCEGLLDDSVRNDHDHDMVITGLRQSLGIDVIKDDGGRTAFDPTDSSTNGQITNLTVFILDEQGSMVYENHYYGYNYWDFYQSIPDSIYIPSLPEGNYTLHAVSLDFYNYYYDADYHNEAWLLHPYLYGNGPIYVGKEDFTLTEDAQLVEISMSNISAQIAISLVEGQELKDAGLSVIFEATDNTAYSFTSGELVPYENSYPITYYASLNNGYYYPEDDEYRNPTSTSIYILPATLTRVTVEYWDYYGNYINQSLDLDPYMELATDDKINIILDLEKILEGAGSGVFDWQDIEWNDRGELTIP